jgi:ketosteroid isomerase-like protein
MVSGRPAIKQFFDGMVQQMGLPVLRLNTLQVEERGDTAWEVGAYTMKLGDISDAGKYIVVWKRLGDDWKLAADIWNTDSALPAA